MMEDTDLYVLMVERNRFHRSHGELSAVPLQAYNRVRQFWKMQGNSGFPTIDFFLHLPLEEFASMRNVGKSILSFVAAVQDNYETQRRR